MLRRGPLFRRLLADMERRERFSADDWQRYQDERLRELLEVCARDVPYYADLFRREGLEPAQMSPRELLARVPPLEKATVREHPERFLNRRLWKRLGLRKAYTSGTTGTPLVCYRDLYSVNFEHAMIWRQWRWSGFTIADRRVTLRGDMIVPAERKSPPFWQANPAERQLLMSSYHISESTIAAYLDALRGFAPAAIEGYPSAVYLLAVGLAERGESYPAKAVFTSSETLLDHQRERIEQVFRCKVFDLYGNTERTAAIGTCEEGSYHVFPDYALVEFIGGEILGTPLVNHAFPLLRYRSGDTADPGVGVCSCGRAMPVVAAIHGRCDAYVVTPEGRQIGRLDHIYKGVSHIRESQIVQKERDRVVLRVVAAPGYSPADEERLLKHAIERLGPAMRIEVERVDSIPRTARGKFLAVVNELGTGS
jgi:phenylacetate-CoA ligase